jgi:hypothetical protein
LECAQGNTVRVAYKDVSLSALSSKLSSAEGRRDLQSERTAISLNTITIYVRTMKMPFVLLSVFIVSAYAASGLCILDPYKLATGEFAVEGTAYDYKFDFPCTKNYSVSLSSSLT